MERKRQCSSADFISAPPKRAASAGNLIQLSRLELPHELIVDILSRLSVKSLLKFRCVCKSWDALLYDTHFLNKHKHANSAHRKIIIMPDPCRDQGMLPLSFRISTLCRDKSRAKVLPLRLPNNDYGVARIIGSCNGMVCLRVVEGDETIYFWNPLSNQSIKLPYTFSTSHHFNILGFGFDDSINEFKLVRLFADFSNCTVFKGEVYGMWEGGRRPIKSAFPYGRPYCSGMSGRPLGSGVYLNGALHWIWVDSSGQLSNNHSRWVIVAFDLAKETFQTVLLHDQQEYWDDIIGLYCVGEWLCVMIRYHLNRDRELWIMKEYGVKESWVKLVTIPFVRRSCQVSYPLYFSESNGEVLMILHGKLVLYHSRGVRWFQNLGIDCDCEDYDACHTYVDTLFTPSVMMGLRGESYQQHTRLRVTSRNWDDGVITWCKRPMIVQPAR